MGSRHTRNSRLYTLPTQPSPMMVVEVKDHFSEARRLRTPIRGPQLGLLANLEWSMLPFPVAQYRFIRMPLAQACNSLALTLRASCGFAKLEICECSVAAVAARAIGKYALQE
jgi:hypothetical protein